MVTPMLATALVLVWWLFASRLRWADRGLVLGVFALAAAATVLVSRQTLGMALLLYGVPAVLSVWVGWLLVTYRLRWPVRRAGLLVGIVLVCGLFMLVRVNGMTGTFTPAFSWRWSPTAEDRLLASLAASSHRPAETRAADAAETTDTPAANAAAANPATAITLAPGDWPGFRGPARDGRLFGVEIATDWQKSPPKQLWRHLIGPGWSSFAVVGDRVYTQEQRGDDEMVVCYDAQDGAELWAHRDATRFSELVAGAGPRSTPTFDDGHIYALGGSGHLNCLDAATGAVLWSRDIVKDSGAALPQWGFSSSPLVVQGIVTVFAGGPEGKSVLGYNAQTGELAWSAGDGKLSYCSTHLAHFDGVEQLLIATEHGVTSFEPETGKILWVHYWPTETVARIVQPAVLNTSDLLIGTGMGIGTRRIHIGHDGEKWPTEEMWTSKSIKPYYNDMVIQGTYLYGFDGNIFMCVGWDDGKMRWRTRGSDNGAAYGNGQVLLLAEQNLLLILTESGEVALVEAQPEKFQEIARFKAIEGKTWNHPVIAHGKLFVRNAEEVACYELAPLAGQARAPKRHRRDNHQARGARHGKANRKSGGHHRRQQRHGPCHGQAVRGRRRLRLHHRPPLGRARRGRQRDPRQRHRGRRSHRRARRRGKARRSRSPLRHRQTRKGRIDVLFANAGIGELGTLGEISEAHFDKIFDINVKGVLFTVQKALPLFADGGSIILNASIAASTGVAGFAVYSASKAAVRSFARCFTSDLKQRKIRVNAISPGPIETPIFNTMGLTDEQIEEFKKSFVSTVPLGRIGEADEIAKAALFLASDDSSYITGIELFVDGGMAQV